MSNTKKVAFNTSVQLVGKLVTAATSVLIIAYLTRYLGIAGYGDYATIFAYLGIFGVFVDLGLFVTTVREISKYPDREKTILGNMLGLRIVLGLIIFTLAYFVAQALPYSDIVKTGILIGAISHFIMSLNQVPLSSFQASLTMQKATFSDIVGRVVLLGLVIWFILAQLGFLYLVAAVTVGNLVVFGLNMLMFELQARVWPLFNLAAWKDLLITALPMGIVIILATIYFRIDTVMLSVMKGSFDVGVYSAPYKILEVFLAVPSIFMSSVLPILTKALIGGIDNAKSIFRRSFDFLSIIALPLIVGTMVLATPAMVLIAGPDFVLSGPVLKILIFALGGSFLNGVMIYTIIAANQQKRLILPYIIAVVFNITANFIVIPQYSYFGAAATTVVTELFVLITSMYIVSKYLKLSPNWKVFNKALVASIIMGAIAFYIQLHVIWVALIAVGVYVSLLLITKTISKQDLAIIFSKTDKQ